MKPVKFKEANVIFAKDQPQYQPLPVYKLFIDNGDIISCWQLTKWERIKLLFSGKIWMSLMMFGHPLTPSYLSIKKEDVLTEEKVRENDIFVSTYYPESPLRIK